MKTETKRGHKVLKVIGIILLILFAVIVIFFIKGKIHERRPWYDDNYFDEFKTDAVLEKKYSGRGSFETVCTEFKSDNSKIETIRVFYPAELADSSKSYPMIVSVNASGTRARNYMAVLDRIASWESKVLTRHSTGRKLDMDFTVIDISISGQGTDSETATFSALRFEDWIAVDRFYECVNSAVLSDDPSDSSDNTSDQIRNTGTIMEDAYWQFIEFCYGSEIVSSHCNSDIRALNRICQEYSLPVPDQRITDLDDIFRLCFHEGYSTRFAENKFGITTAETGDWRDLDIAGKAYLELLKDWMQCH